MPVYSHKQSLLDVSFKSNSSVKNINYANVQFNVIPAARCFAYKITSRMLIM